MDLSRSRTVEMPAAPANRFKSPWADQRNGRRCARSTLGTANVTTEPWSAAPARASSRPHLARTAEARKRPAPAQDVLGDQPVAFPDLGDLPPDASRPSPLAALYIGKLIIDTVVRSVRSGGIESGRVWKLVVAELALAVASDLLGRAVALADSLLGDRPPIR